MLFFHIFLFKIALLFLRSIFNLFSKARPPGIYKQDYLDELFRRYGDPEETPGAPPLPQWCTGEAYILQLSCVCGNCVLFHMCVCVVCLVKVSLLKRGSIVELRNAKGRSSCTTVSGLKRNDFDLFTDTDCAFFF